MYDREYFDGYYLNDPKRERAYHDEYQRVIDHFIDRHAEIGGNVLDVGCGIGGFLAYFDDRWTKYGIEPSEYAVKKLQSISLFSDIAEIGSGSMDLVIFRGTLQHINNPIEMLENAERALKPDGLLVILATPNTDGLVYQLFGNLPALDAPRNWIPFGAGMLGNILYRLGFEAEFHFPYLNSPYASPIRDFVNFGISLVFGYRKFAFPGNMMEVYAWKRGR